jgi:hypothetical protein
MNPKLKVSPQQFIDWLKTQGHAHVPTVKLIQKHKQIIDILYSVAIDGSDFSPEEAETVQEFMDTYGS